MQTHSRKMWLALSAANSALHRALTRGDALEIQRASAAQDAAFRTYLAANRAG
jgi:hypothetical protein